MSHQLHTMHDNQLKIEIFPSQERGLTENTWLKSFHSFSFGNFYHPQKLGFGSLRVLNEDTIRPKQGFAQHEHSNMEIITIVLEGLLEHEDTLGNKGKLQAGEVQRMSAGKGISHSEYNGSKLIPVHLLQIWIFPRERDIQPEYEQKKFDKEVWKNCLYPIVSGEKREESVFIHQDATFLLGKLDPETKVTHTIRSQKHGLYLFVIKGEMDVEGKILKKGDSAAIRGIKEIAIHAKKNSEILLIEVGMTAL
ncbi:MAG: pirin family protein [Chlamydiae bacterium]|nr:pirin family protein [Chlamydiota bacterium]